MESNQSGGLSDRKNNERKYGSIFFQIFSGILFAAVIFLGYKAFQIQKNNENLNLLNADLQQDRDKTQTEKNELQEKVAGLEKKDNESQSKIEELSKESLHLQEEKEIITNELNSTCKINKKTPSCFDSDSGFNLYISGYVYAQDRDKGYIKTEDLCIDDKLMEAVCDKNGYAYNGDTYKCPNGCLDGACIKNDSDNNCTCSSNFNCFNLKASSSCQADKSCLWVPEKDWLFGYCEPFDAAKFKVLNPEVKEGEGCTDSDGGINYFEKGTTSGNHEDSCFKDKNWAPGVNYDKNGLYEMYCGDQGSGIQTLTKEYSCSNGCQDGACLR